MILWLRNIDDENCGFCTIKPVVADFSNSSSTFSIAAAPVTLLTPRPPAIYTHARPWTTSSKSHNGSFYINYVTAGAAQLPHKPADI